MKTSLALILATLLIAPVAAETPPRPEHFAHHATISVSDGGPFHQLALPLVVYQGASDAELADLRVFNGQGEALPYALLRAQAQAESQRRELAVPFFPLLVPGPGAAGERDLAVTVRQGADGTLIAVRQSPAAPKSAAIVRGVVVDGSQLKGSIRSLRLLTEASPTAFHRYTVESSSDLQNWRLLKRDAQLVRLEHQGHRVENDGVEWDSAADRYLRLLWADPQRAPAIRSVRLAAVETSFKPPLRLWSPEMAPTAIQGGSYDYAWTGQLPLDRLRINLPQVNTLAPLVIQRQTSRHRHRDRPRWDTLAQAVAYRLQTPQGEVRSADITLHAAVENRLRLAIDARGGAIGSLPPTVQIGFVPHLLVFLARGEGPFVLAWGAGDLGRADLPIATLLPGYDAAVALNATPASLASPGKANGQPVAAAGDGGEDAPVVPARWILWAVLLTGLLVLAAMARALTRQLRPDPEVKP
ncbi:DUF3999 domain-containing protein [Dechloromonas sp. A34]|uniref:DUF3999 domain-containing protein n=1 Tax=Dechloromonas sp. A34 TaxID=447588 RepID=UPI0022491CBA|nr:DUF3999 domain-containing protein [Dechloromonas sp. A34]